MDKKTLAELRKTKCLSQRELAKLLNIGSGAIAMYESGMRMPPLNRAIEIANIFNVSVEDICFSNKETELNRVRGREL